MLRLRGGVPTAVMGAIGANNARRMQAETLQAAKKRQDAAGERQDQERRNRERERLLRAEQHQQEEKMRKAHQAWFDKYDEDASGMLERDELRRCLTDVVPSEPAPSDDLLDTLMSMCVVADGGEGSTAVGVADILAIVLRYREYVVQKQELDRFFTVLDADGSGLLEKDEILKVMSDLAPSHEVCEADLDFVYDACRAERGAPIAPGPSVLLLKQALTEWARITKAADEAARQAAALEAQRAELKAANSSACVVL